MSRPALADTTPLEQLVIAQAELLSDAAGAQAEALLSRLRLSSEFRRRYIFFLKWMYETFHAVGECFPQSEQGRAGRIDAICAGTSPQEMLYLANHLFLLHHAGVPGSVLECGCFKGFSTCCLSHACSALGRRLVVADSFQGLPEPGDEGA